MINHRMLGGALLAATALTCATPAAAQRVARIVSFGDSYADTGNAIAILLANPATPAAVRGQLTTLYPTGRFSGGTNYVDTLAQLLNVPVVNFAVGGATTGTANNGFPGIPGLTQEVAIFGSNVTPPGTIFPIANGFHSGDLLALSIGGNDARAYYTANPNATTAQAAAAATTSVVQATTNINQLVAAGAPTISFLALDASGAPDLIGRTSAQALAKAFSASFNNGFQGTLAGYAANGTIVHYLDGATVLANVAANPGAFGISNIYCPAAPNPTCLQNQAGYLFYADGVHLTSDGFKIIGQYVAAQVTAPLTLQAPGDAAMDSARQFGRTMTTRVDLGAPRDGDMPEGVAAYIVGDTVSRTLHASRTNDQFKTTSSGLTAGLEGGFGAGLVGAAVNVSRPKANFANDLARDEVKSVSVGVYGGAGIAGGFVQGYAGIGRDRHDLSRVGVVAGMEARAKGRHTIAGIKAGYLMPMGGIRVGPVVALDHARVRVNGYTETGDPALTLNVGKARYSSLRGSAGAELRGDFGANGMQLRPYFAAVAEKDFKGDGRVFDFSQTSAPIIVNHYRVEDVSKKIYGRLSAGLSASVLANVSVNAVVSGTVAKKQGNETSGHVGVRAAF